MTNTLLQTDSSEDEIIFVEEGVSSESPEKIRITDKKILNIPVEKESPVEECPTVFTSDTSGGKSDKDEIEEDPGLDSEQEDSTGSLVSKLNYFLVYELNNVAF